HRGNLDGALTALLPSGLEGSVRPADRFAILHVLRRGLQAGTRHADVPGGDANPTAVPPPHRLIPAVAFLADQVLLRNAAIVEGQVRGRTRTQPQLRRRLDVGYL